MDKPLVQNAFSMLEGNKQGLTANTLHHIRLPNLRGFKSCLLSEVQSDKDAKRPDGPVASLLLVAIPFAPSSVPG